MTFYYQLSVLVADDAMLRGSRVLSSFKTHAPWDVIGGQTASVGLYAAPTSQDSHIFYSLQWPEAGRLVSVMLHAHQRGHQESLLFAAPPAALGLGSRPHSRALAGTPNAAVRSAVMSKARALGALVCSAVGRLERLPVEAGYAPTMSGGACFDRAAVPACSRRTWRKGEVATVLTLNGPMVSSGCGVAREAAARHAPRGTMRQHSIFFIAYEATGEKKGSSVYDAAVPLLPPTSGAAYRVGYASDSESYFLRGVIPVAPAPSEAWSLSGSFGSLPAPTSLHFAAAAVSLLAFGWGCATYALLVAMRDDG